MSTKSMAHVPSEWSDERIRQRIQELDAGLGWYQDIDLGNGIRTKTRRVWGEDIDHPRKRWAEVASAVPRSLAGSSVLDIGCNAGFIAFEARDRGATDVCGVDHNPGYIEQAEFCAEVRRQPEIDFRAMSVYDLPTMGRRFDLVFFVGVLYHCKYLAQAVEAVSKVCAGTMIVETAIHPGASEVPLVRYVRSSGYQGPTSSGAARLPGHWHPNMTALRDLFLEQGFAEAEELFRDGGRGGYVFRR